jgi:hypothetical protein
MPIIDAICEADSEREIYFLLTAYVEAIRHCDKLGALPERLTRLPFPGVEDLKIRVEELRADFGEIGERDRAVLRETIEIFCAATERLEALAAEVHGEIPMAA